MHPSLARTRPHHPPHTHNRPHRVYTDYLELAADYASGALHPGDLKPALARHLNDILQPVRDHFEKDEEAKALLKAVRSYKVTK